LSGGAARPGPPAALSARSATGTWPRYAVVRARNSLPVPGSATGAANAPRGCPGSSQLISCAGLLFRSPVPVHQTTAAHSRAQARDWLRRWKEAQAAPSSNPGRVRPAACRTGACGGAQLGDLAALRLHAAPGGVVCALPPIAQLAARVRFADGQQHLQGAACLGLYACRAGPVTRRRAVCRCEARLAHQRMLRPAGP